MEPVKILVVDDDEAFCEMMLGHLKRKGFQTEKAMDGLEAIQILRSSGPFSVMVTDLMMPGLSGLELLRRAKKLDPLIEVIVITAAGSIEMAISALREDGAYDYLTKPLEIIGELSLAVERAIAHRQMNLEREAVRGSLVNGTRRLKEILSRTGCPVIVGNERDEIILLGPAETTTARKELCEQKENREHPVEPFHTLLERWRSLGGNQVAWVETKLENGEDVLVKIGPLQMGELLGWVILLHDITYLKKLERYVVGSIAKVTTRIIDPVEKARMCVAELEEKWDLGEKDARMHLGQLKDLFEEAHEGTRNLLIMADNGSGFPVGNESTPLQDFFERNRDSFQTKHVNGRSEDIQWELSEDLPTMGVDASLISELFHHLLQYSKLRSEETTEIQIKTWSTGGEIWLSVQDNGPNTSSSLSALKAVPDSQVPSLTNGQMELALVKLLAEQMGFQVWSQQVETGGLLVAICFHEAQDDTESDLI